VVGSPQQSVHDLTVRTITGTPAGGATSNSSSTAAHLPQQQQQHHAAHSNGGGHHEQHPHQHSHQQHPADLTQQASPPQDATTNTFGYPPGVADPTVAAQAEAQVQAQNHAQIQAQAEAQAHQVQSNFASPGAAAGGYNQHNNAMLGAYRTTAYSDHYGRAPPPPALRSTHATAGPGWTAYGSALSSLRGPGAPITHASHTAVTRPSLTTLPHPSSGAPQLVRTSTLNQPAAGVGPTSSAFNPYAIYPTKATLKIMGDLHAMAENWTHEEFQNKRRIVLFKKQQQGPQLTTSFRPVSVSERPPHSICISCIYWTERAECFVTSVDTIHLLEQLVASPARFTVEEKNRIRRNLEGFHPLTVSKAKAESEDFFKLIMAFGNPKPRNIEKDVKVFPWKILSQALTKIISKYSASPSSTLPPATPQQLLTPVSLSGSYPPMPPMVPTGAQTPTDNVQAAGYVGATHAHHADNVGSPRPMSNGSWGGPSAYPARVLSPGRMKTSSPTSGSGLRISTLPGSGYDARASQSLASPYGMPTPTPTHHHSPNHHTHHSAYGPSASIPVSQGHAHNGWDGYAPVPEEYSAPPTAPGSNHYGNGPYGDAAGARA
jgi:hypothetical protein